MGSVIGYHARQVNLLTIFHLRKLKETQTALLHVP